MPLYRSATLQQYCDDLAAKLPAPGGGSAAALSAALGVSLVSMVVNFTLGKPKYAAYEQELKKILEQSERLRAEFLAAVDEDVEAYQSKDIERSLAVPLQVSKVAYAAILLCPPLIIKSNRNLISDVSVAAVLLEAAFASAACNVEINLKYLNDPRRTSMIRKEIKTMAKRVQKIRIKTEASVGRIIRG